MMKKKKVRVVVIKEDQGYSASTTIDKNFIATEADSFEELKARMLTALNFTFEDRGLIFILNDIVFE